MQSVVDDALVLILASLVGVALAFCLTAGLILSQGSSATRALGL